MTATLKVMINQATGDIDIITDGELTPERGEELTRQLEALLGEKFPQGFKLTSGIEQHKTGGVRHAHIVSTIRH